MAALYLLIGGILKITTALFALIIWMSDALLGVVLSGALAVQDMDSVNVGWSIARDTINMFFVIFLLVIAFTTILRIEAYQYKQLLPKLILGILLVNFSRTICAVLIEFSNVLTSAFLNFAPGQETAAGIAALMGISSVWDIDSGIGALDITNLTMCISMALITIYMGGLAIAFAGLTGMMITRTIALLVLIVLSPIAFGMNILPVTSTYFKKWWDEFIKYLFYGPIAAFCIYLSAIVAAEMRDHDTSGFRAEAWDSALNHSSPTLPATQLTQTEFVWGYALVVGLLFLGIAMIKEGGGYGAQIAMDFAKKGMTGGAKLVGGWGRRKLASDRLGKTAKGLTSKGKAGWLAGKALGGVHNMAKLTYLPQAWKAQKEKEESEVGGLATGWARDQINNYLGKIPGSTKDKNQYEYAAHKQFVDEAKHRFNIENKGQAWQYYVNRLKESAGVVGEEADVEAAIQELCNTKNINELLSAATKDEDLAIKLFGSKEAADENKGEYTPKAALAMYENLFGKENGRSMFLDMSEQAVGIGNWQFKEFLKRDPDSGRLVAAGEEGYSEQQYKENWAGEFAKRDFRDRMGAYRGDFMNMTWDKETGEEIRLGMTPGYEENLRAKGFNSKDGYRGIPSMTPAIKGHLVEPGHFAGLNKNGEKVTRGVADVLRDQFAAGGEEAKKAKNTLQIYYEIGEDVTMPAETQRAIEDLVDDFQVVLEPPGRGSTSYGHLRKYGDDRVSTPEGRAARRT